MDNTAQDNSALTISLRVPDDLLKQVDAAVKIRNVGANRVTRTSLILNWIERGLREDKRTR